MTMPAVAGHHELVSLLRAARKLFATKKVTISEIDVESAPEKRAEMRNRSCRTSVPQIFIGDRGRQRRSAVLESAENSTAC